MNAHIRIERWLACACLMLGPVLHVAHAAIPAEERDALIALYASTNGDAWVNNSNWCAGACPSSGEPVFDDPGTECGWAGIGCDGAQTHVTSIVLFHNNMIGPLPPSLSALAALQVLDLDNDGLLGPMPDLAGLAELQILDVHQNDIDGPMPALSGATSLQTVRLFGNHFSGPLPDLSGLTQLATFLAYSNDFTGPIPDLADLVALQEFAVHDNALTGPIPSLDGLAALVTFDVEHNQLSGAIPDLSGLSSLLAFRVGDNRLTGVVPAFPQNSGGAPSSLCPNPLDTTPGPNDADWDTHTGYTPWWATPYANNLCDDIFTDAFDAAAARRAMD